MVDNTRVFLGDCLPAMKEFPDKYFDLAIVDVPYGETCVLTGGKAKANGYREYWDKITDDGHWNIAPDINYLSNFLPPSSGWIFWDKGQRDFSFSDGELAYTSFNIKLKAITIHRQELQTERRQHPTQKPTKLYKWLLKNYAKEGDKILDTHLGSGSSRIAAFDMGFDFTGYELDKDYFEAAEKRFQQHKSQLKLFA